MAEENSDSLVTHGDNEADGTHLGKGSGSESSSANNGSTLDSDHRRASTGSFLDKDSPDRNTIEKTSTPKSSQNVVSRYLRASTGSCHDFCKYGKKHEYEAKSRLPLPKRMSNLPSKGLNPVDAAILVKKKKTPAVENKPYMDKKMLSPELKPSSDTETSPPDSRTLPDRKVGSPGQMTSSGVVAEKKKKMIIKKKASGDLEIPLPELRASSDTRAFSSNHESSTDRKICSSDHSGIKTHLQKHKPSPTINVASSSPKTHLQKHKSSPIAKAASASPKTHPQKRRSSPKAKAASASPPEIIKREIVVPSQQPEASTSEQDFTTGNKMERIRKTTEKSPKKHSPPEQLKPVKVKPLSSSNISDEKHGKSRISIGVKGTGQRAVTSKASVGRALAPQDAPLSPRISLNRTVSLKSSKTRGLKLASPLKDRGRLRKADTEESIDEVPEKTLHVIKAETVKGVFESPHGEEEEVVSRETEYDESMPNKNRSPEMRKAEPVEENHFKTQRKGSPVVSEPKDSSPIKLKFRKGKVLDLQSENNSPRRLRFKKGGVLVGSRDGKVDTGRRTYKNRGVIDEKTGEEIHSEKVVLKHQDVQGKKDAQGLLNNVIEETASKLVETRKSKVKALVGAFETVISLQDRKPASSSLP